MMAVEKNDKDGDYMYYGEISKYDGTSQCGKGIRVWLEGDSPAILIGWFRNGVFTGHGRNIFEKSLLYYEGDFYNFKFHGQGTFKHIDNESYTGQFRSGQQHGFGEQRFNDGRIYTGEFKDGKIHGKGKMEYTIEQYRREGEWKNGRMEGEQTVTYKNGQVRKQIYVDYELAEDVLVKKAD